jgi:tetratricopeptide (TPR) repeat protein
VFPAGAKRAPVVATPIASVAILPFRNASGNPQFDWIGQNLADMLGTDIGQSAQIHTVSSERIHDILNDLHIGPAALLDPDLVGRVASFTSADVVVSGQFVTLGDHVRVDATFRDLKHERTVPLKVETSQNDLLSGIDTLAKSVRENLAVSPEVAKEMAANAFKPESKSLAALRAYNEGADLMRHGNNAEAVKKFQEATSQDSKFALAYSKMAQAYAALGYDNDAESASRQAVQIEERSPSPQRSLIQATHYRILHDTDKAIGAYEKLTQAFPENDDFQLALAKLYEDTRATDKASEHYQLVLNHDPKNTSALIGMGRAALLKGDAQGSIDYLNRALALAVQVDNEDQKASTLFLLGTAYGMLNKPNDALRSFQESLDIRQRRDDKGGSAQVLNSMAQMQEDLGQYAAAQKNYEEALRLRREIGDKHGTGNTLLDLGSLYESRGKYDEALDFSKQSLQIQRELNDPQNEASCLNNIGGIYLDKGDYENANTYFQQALQLREKLSAPAAIAETVYNLADTASRMGQYDQAIAYFLRASELWRKVGDNKGLATAAYGLGRLFEYQGRYGAAVNSEQDALKNYQMLKEHGVLLAQIQGGYGHALSLVGRDAEARKNLDEALALARESKNNGIVSQLLNYEGDSLFYTGDYNDAALSYKDALNAATQAKDRENVLTSKFNLAKATVQQGHVKYVIKELKQLSGDADKAGLKYLSIACSTYAAQAMIGARDLSGAREQLDRNANASEKLNLKRVLAQNQYLMGTALRDSGQPREASEHFGEARRLADEIRQEAGDGVMKRSDLKDIYAAGQ